MKKKNIIPAIAVIIVMAAITIKPSRYILSAQNGIILFALTVLPALFPFFFFSKLLSLFEADVAMGNILRRPLIKMYNAPPSGGYIFIMSLMCGYPIGSKLISEYYNDHIIEKEDAHSLAALASTSGPLFILGTIGSVILNNHLAGIVIIISHYLSAIINGLIYRNKNKSRSFISPPIVSTTLKDSIYNAVISILMVGGYIIVFNIICDVFIDFHIIDMVSKTLTPIFGNIIEGVLFGIIEVTRGSVVIGASSAGIIAKTAAITAAVTFGGMSIIIQSATFLESTGLKISRFILMKLTQCTIAYVIALGLAFILFS